MLLLVVGGGGGRWCEGLGGLADVLVKADVDEGLAFLLSGGTDAPGLDDVTGPGMEEGALDAALGLKSYHLRLVSAPENTQKLQITERWNISKKK